MRQRIMESGRLGVIPVRNGRIVELRAFIGLVEGTPQSLESLPLCQLFGFHHLFFLDVKFSVDVLLDVIVADVDGLLLVPDRLVACSSNHTLTEQTKILSRPVVDTHFGGLFRAPFPFLISSPCAFQLALRVFITHHCVVLLGRRRSESLLCSLSLQMVAIARGSPTESQPSDSVGIRVKTLVDSTR